MNFQDNINREQPSYATLIFSRESKVLTNQMSMIIKTIEKHLKGWRCPFCFAKNNKCTKAICKETLLGKCRDRITEGLSEEIKITASWISLPAETKDDQLNAKRRFVVSARLFLEDYCMSEAEDQKEKKFAPFGNMESINGEDQSTERRFERALQQGRVVDNLFQDKDNDKNREEIHAFLKNQEDKPYPMSEDGIRDALQDIQKSNPEDISRSAVDNAFSSLVTEYMTESWRRDFQCEVATYSDVASSQLPGSSKHNVDSLKMNIKSRGQLAENIQPRHYVVNYHLASLTPTYKKKLHATPLGGSPEHWSTYSQFFPCTPNEVQKDYDKNEEQQWPQGAIKLSDDIPLAARVAVESIEASLPEGRFAAQLIVPLIVDGKSGFITLLLSFPETAWDRFFSHNRSIVERCVYEFWYAIARLGSAVSDDPYVVSTTKALAESFTLSGHSIKKVFHSLDNELLKDSFNETDWSCLEPLASEIESIYKETIEPESRGTTSPLEHPLDSMTKNILRAFWLLIQNSDADDAKYVQGKGLISPLIKFASQERLLLGDAGHREHYFHTFKVFLLGRHFLKCLELYGNKEDRLRERWLFSALFHDVCYPIQKHNEWLNNYLRAFLSSDSIEVKISTHQVLDSWENSRHQTNLFDLLLQVVDRRLSYWFSNGSDDKDHFPRRFQAAVIFNLQRRNHAVLAAIALLEKAVPEQHSKNFHHILPEKLLHPSDEFKETEIEPHQLSPIFDAATAILLHDSKVWSMVSEGKWFNWKHLHSKKCGEVVVAKLTWALACCDMIQEWGRDLDLEGADINWATPVSSNFQDSEKKMKIQIIYSHEFGEKLDDIKNAFDEFLKTQPLGDAVCIGAPTHGDKTNFNESYLPFDEPFSGINDRLHTKVFSDDWVKDAWGSTATDLCYCSNVCDLLDEELDVTTLTWRRAFWMLFCKSKLTLDYNSEKIRNSQREWLQNCNLKIPSSDTEIKMQAIVEWRTELLDKRNANGSNVRVLFKILKRLRGFWRIPWQTWFFWGFPDDPPLTYERLMQPKSDGALQRIDKMESSLSSINAQPETA